MAEIDMKLIYIIAGCVGAGAFLVILICVCFCLYKRKRRRDKELGLYTNYQRSSLRSNHSRTSRSSRDTLDDLDDVGSRTRHNIVKNAARPPTLSVTDGSSSSGDGAQQSTNRVPETRTVPNPHKTQQRSVSESDGQPRKYGALKVISKLKGSRESLDTFSSITCTSEKPRSSMASAGRQSSIEELSSMLDKPQYANVKDSIQLKPSTFYTPPDRLKGLAIPDEVPTAATYAPVGSNGEDRTHLPNPKMTIPPRPPKIGQKAAPSQSNRKEGHVSQVETDIDDYSPKSQIKQNLMVTNL